MMCGRKPLLVMGPVRKIRTPHAKASLASNNIRPCAVGYDRHHFIGND
jgi:hypothetical protein